MRPHQIIGAMSAEEFEKIMGAIEAESPEALQSTTIAAAQVLKFRPKFLLKQPPAKRLSSIKGALSRVTGASLAEELLAVYFLKCRLPLLTEWLDPSVELLMRNPRPAPPALARFDLYDTTAPGRATSVRTPIYLRAKAPASRPARPQ